MYGEEIVVSGISISTLNEDICDSGLNGKPTNTALNGGYITNELDLYMYTYMYIYK